MSTVVLRSQDCLRNRFRELSMACPPYSSKPGRNSARSSRRKRNPVKSDGKIVESGAGTVKFPGGNLIKGKMYILKRGETLRSNGSSLEKEADGDLFVCSTERNRPDPELVRKQIRLPEIRIGGRSGELSSHYAGTVFESSPSPSSLPLPAFFKKTKPRSEDLATKDLRRMLQLEF